MANTVDGYLSFAIISFERVDIFSRYRIIRLGFVALLCSLGDGIKEPVTVSTLDSIASAIAWLVISLFKIRLIRPISLPTCCWIYFLSRVWPFILPCVMPSQPCRSWWHHSRTLDRLHRPSLLRTHRKPIAAWQPRDYSLRRHP